MRTVFFIADDLLHHPSPC